MKYKCLNCGYLFDKPLVDYERHGLDHPPYEKVNVCPRCRDTDIDWSDDDEEP